MLKENKYIFKNLNILLDIFLVIAAFWLAHFIRNEVLSTYILPLVVPYRQISAYILYLVVFLPIFIISLNYNEYYHSQRMKTPFQVTRIIFVSIIVSTMITIALLLFIRKTTINRPQILIFTTLLFFIIVLKSSIIKNMLISLREKGYNFRTLLLIGSGKKLEEFIKTVDKHPYWGFKIIGIISDDPDDTVGSQNYGYKIVAHLSEAVDYLFRNAIDIAIFIPYHTKMEDLEPILQECEEMGIKTSISLNFLEVSIATPDTDIFENIPVLTYNPTRAINKWILIKYIFDKVAGLILLILFSPLMLLIALLIKLFPGGKSGPVFYKQIRSGLYGKTFYLYKFRSMVPDADEKLKELIGSNEMAGPVFKIKNDPRITPIGRFIRKTSIDELPQLINVVKGEMSLVGPRPPLPDEVLKYDKWQRRRLSMKPGITCLWQVMGRNQIPFEKWMKLDLEYIDNWSLFLDFKILVRTVFVVLTGHGAM